MKLEHEYRKRLLSIFRLCGGVDGSRTRDLAIANGTLSQLSYNPVCAVSVMRLCVVVN
jgi:hypothetical protein